MTSQVDFSKVTPATRMRGETTEETRELRAMLREARNYLKSFPWCSKILSSYFGFGVGGVVAVFLFEIKPSRPEVDELVWVVVGDLPPAYITIDNAPNPACALDGYIGAMEEWVKAAKEGKSVENLIPVNAPPTKQYARMLGSRLKFLDKRILAYYAEDLTK